MPVEGQKAYQTTAFQRSKLSHPCFVQFMADKKLQVLWLPY